MAARVGAGELRTKIMVFEPAESAQDSDGYSTNHAVNVFGEGRHIHCKWVNAHGREVYDAKQAGVTEPATLTLRYTSKITPRGSICRDGDPAPYEIISVNDVENRHAWLEIRVQRKAASG